MQRDSDNDINEAGGKEDDHILKIKGNNKKKKKSHSRVPVIVPIASTSMDTTGKVDVKRPKKTAQVEIFFFVSSKCKRVRELVKNFMFVL